MHITLLRLIERTSAVLTPAAEGKRWNEKLLKGRTRVLQNTCS